MRSIISLACMFFVLTTVSAFAEEITMKEFLDLVKENHPFFTKEALTADIEKKQAETYLGDEDWNLSITPSFSHSGEVTASEYGANRIENFGIEAGVSRKLWSTGGQLGFSVSSGYRNSDFTTLNRFKHGIGVSYTHPLLQNSKGKLYRLNYDLSKYAIDSAEIQALENQEEFILDVTTRFLDWVRLSEMIQISRERLNLAEEQLKQTEKKRKANLVDKVDVLRSQDAVRIAEQALLQIESQWKAKQAELSVLAQDRKIYEKNPAYGIYTIEKLPGIEKSLSDLKKQSRVLKTLAVLKEKLTHSREGLVEQDRPELNLTLSGWLYGSDEQFVESLGIYKPDVLISAGFTMPIEKRTVNAKIEKVDLQIMQIDEDINNIEVNLEASLRNLFIQIVEMEKILALNQEQIASAQEKTTEEVKMYNQGRGQLTFVIQSRDNEENAKLTYVENAVFYHSLLFQYRALLDELLTAEQAIKID